MIRTRGLRRTLGKVLGRDIGRQVSGDVEEFPQRRRPTTSGRRQQTTAVVAGDVDHADHNADEVHEEPQELVTDDVGANTKGFSGRPQDTSVLTNYVYHVAVRVWTREVVIC